MLISDEQFENYLQLAIDSIVPEFRIHFNEVPIVVEQRPDAKTTSHFGHTSNRLILGLFQGTPLGKQLHSGPHSTQITLYRRNILACCPNAEQLPDLIRKVLVHELGHYMGFSDEQLRDHDY